VSWIYPKMKLNKDMNYTPYKDVNEVLNSLTSEIAPILGENLVGVYLTGSLSYGDFNPENSDIDLLVIVKNPLSEEKLEALKKMHLDVERNNDKWAKRIECSYVSFEMLPSILPPKTPRPYIGEGTFYPEAPYGNEWVIKQYLLYNHGIPLLGPDFKTLVKPIDIEDVRAACIRDLFEEWEPKINDLEWLNNSHYQSYIVLNLCRILYMVMRHTTATKKISASWVKHEFAPEWSPLIQTAEDWHYGKEMNLKEQTIEFIQFVVSKVRKSI
jgi:predicted nucleotidyltransferase